MKAFLKTFYAFTVAVLFSCMLASVAETALPGVGPLVALFAFVLQSIPVKSFVDGVGFAAIQREFWVNYIIDNLFKDNLHLENCFKADDFVIGGAVVHIPQAGGKPNVETNRSSLPATVVKRTDVDIVYVLNEFTTDPTLISKTMQESISYDKIGSVIGEHVNTLAETIGDDIIYQWLREFAFTGSQTTAAAPVIRTTGAAVAAHLPSATGNRKLFLKEDLKRARFLMNKANVLKTDRFAIIPSDLLDQLQDDEDLKKRDSALELDMANGSIGRLYGFEILERSSTAVYSNAATPVVKAPGATAAGTDNDSVICYQRNAVECARGETNLFEDNNNPEYYGDIYSALVRMGGRKRRKAAEGIIAIVQDASA